MAIKNTAAVATEKREQEKKEIDFLSDTLQREQILPQKNKKLVNWHGILYTRNEIVAKLSQNDEPIFKPKELDLESVALASYPRCGNALTRSYIQYVSGIYTGSDFTVLDRDAISKPLQLTYETIGKPKHIEKDGKVEEVVDMFEINAFNSKILYDGGFKGQGLIQDEAWVIMTHYPHTLPLTPRKEYNVNKCILVIRNPYDSIYSMFHAFATLSFNKSLPSDDFYRRKSSWEQFVAVATTEYKLFHEFWLQCDLPIHIVRYEDMLWDPKSTLLELFRFLVEEDGLSREIELKIQDLVHKIESNTFQQVYTPRSGQILNSIAHYQKDQIDLIQQSLSDLLEKFSYTSHRTTRRSLFSKKEENEQQVAESLQPNVIDYITQRNKNALKRVLKNDSKSYNLQIGDKENLIKKKENLDLFMIALLNQ